MFDAAIEGTRGFANYAYFFVGRSYLTYDWTAGTDGNGRVADFGPRPLSEWNLPARFLSGISGAINGAGKFAGKAYFLLGPEAAYGYFLKDNDYLRYRWATSSGGAAGISAGYPKRFAERRVAGITGGVDAVVNGR